MDDEAYEQKLVLLEKILCDGISKLLTDARDNEFLEEPFGRAPAPTPLITEEQFVKAGGLAGHLPDEPEFSFEYGFNPLEYLSRFITWSHPDSVKAREQAKLDAVTALTHRAHHASKQLDTSLALQDLVVHIRSGIYWGPIVSPIPVKEENNHNDLLHKNNSQSTVPTCSVIIMSKSYKIGWVTIEVSESPDFLVIEKTSSHEIKSRPKQNKYVEGATDNDNNELETQPQDQTSEETEDSAVVSLESILPVKATIHGLKFGTQYYIRCHASDTAPVVPEVKKDSGFYSDDEDEVKDGVASVSADDLSVAAEPKYYQKSCFWTLPSDELQLPTQNMLSSGEDGVNDMTASRVSLFSSGGSVDGQGSMSQVEGSLDIACAPVSLLCFGQITGSGAVNNTNGSTVDTVETENSVTIRGVSDSLDAVVPHYTALLGDLFYNTNKSGAMESYNPTSHDNILSRLYNKSVLFVDPQSSVCRKTCLLYAPRDGSFGARRFLNSEEVMHRQFRHDLRRYNKKYNINANGKDTKDKTDRRRTSNTGTSAAVAAANKDNAAATATSLSVVPPPPVMKRLPLPESLQALFELFPIDFTEDYDSTPPVATVADTKPGVRKPPLTKQQEKEAAAAALPKPVKGTRMLYRTLMMGPDIQVIILDMRGSADEGGAAYLGKEQSEWLTTVLMNSTTMWKVILCGYSFGVVGIQASIDDVLTPTTRPNSQQLMRFNSAPSLGDLMPGNDGNATGTRPSSKQSSVSFDATASNNPVLVSALATAKNTVTAAVDGDITAVTGSDNNTDGTSVPPKLTTQRSVKQFQLQVPEESDKPLLDEDLEETYSRSKHSLSHILATVQSMKYNSAYAAKHSAALVATGENNTADVGSSLEDGGNGADNGVQPQTAHVSTNADITAALGSAEVVGEPPQQQKQQQTDEVELTSGIIVLTSGIARIVRAGSALTPPHHGDITRETVVPAFVATYSTLHGEAKAEHTVMKVNSNTNKNSDTRDDDEKNDFETSSSILPFCAEIGLGGRGGATGCVSNRAKTPLSRVGKFGYLAGFDANTLFSAGMSTKSGRNSLCSSADGSPSACELSLTADGALCVRVMETHLNVPEQGKTINGCASSVGYVMTVPGKMWYECKFRSQMLLPPPVDDEESVSVGP